MTRRRRPLALASATVAAVVGAAVVLVQAGLASPLRGNQAEPVRIDRGMLGRLFFSGGFARAEVVIAPGGVPRSLRFDRGRVRAAGNGSITLLERDGTIVTVPVSPAAVVRLRGRPVPLERLRRGLVVLTLREGDQPATLVEAARR